MTYNDIVAYLEEIYGLEISNGALSSVADKMDDADSKLVADNFPTGHFFEEGFRI